MCGIAGWVDWRRDLTGERHTVEAMGRTLSHRGPDDEGFWMSERAGLAHRRLIVVDPAGGCQPMVRRQGGKVFVIVYNGELYNTTELRRELQARGHSFDSYSDTEVLLVSYIEWGPGCLSRLNGIFAFAVWSEADQSLFLARDRLGVKPLFYAQRGSALLFGSEIKAILANPLVAAEVDAEGLAEIFLIGPARTPGFGVFRDISELRPAHYLLHSRAGTQVRRYWSLASAPHADDLDATVEKVRFLLKDTVRRQLVSDVPVCSLLSGGLDSSGLTAHAAAAHKGSGGAPLHTFSIDYVDNDLHFKANEYQPAADRDFIRLMVERTGAIHHQITIGQHALVDALSASVEASDLPGLADVDSSLLLFCREIKKDATVALSGESADEIFGGYPWFRWEETLEARNFPWARKVRERGSLLAPDLAARVRPDEHVRRRYEEAIAEVPRLESETGADARRREMFYLNITRFMPTLLDRKDRMSMASGLEVRVPFCDHRLAEYAWNIPWDMKFCDQMEKGVLRRALSDVLPGPVRTRKKSPYPKTHHPQYYAMVKSRFLDVAADRTSPLTPLLDADTVKEIVATDAAAFGPSWFGQLMGGAQLFAYLLEIDHWLRKYRVSVRID